MYQNNFVWIFNPYGLKFSIHTINIYKLSTIFHLGTMSVKEMDSAQNFVLKSNKCEPELFINSSHRDRMFEVLQSSRNQ